MKKTIVVVLSLVLMGLPLVAQETSEDVVSPETLYIEGTRSLEKYDVGQALRCFENAQKGFHEKGDKKYELDSWCHVGWVKRFLGDFHGAWEAYRQAELMALSLQSSDKLASIYKEQYLLSKDLNNNGLRQELMQKMDSLADSFLDDKTRFPYYDMLGDMAKEYGDFIMAERWYKKNDPYIMSLDKGKPNGDRRMHYGNLCSLYEHMGRWDDALYYAQLNKKEIQKEEDAIDPSQYVFSYNEEALIYRRMGDSVRCFQAIDTMFSLLNLVDEPRKSSKLYLTRAVCNNAFGNYENALDDYKAADSLLATKYGELDEDRVRLLPLMGGVEHRLGRYESSENYYRQYAERLRELLGERHSDYINSLVYLANAEGINGRIDAACEDYTIAFAKLRQKVQDDFPYLTTCEREGYWKSVSEAIWNMTPFAIAAQEFQTPFTEACYNGLILSKSFLLESERTVYDLIKEEGTEDDKRDLAAIDAARSEIRELERKEDKNTDSILLLTKKIERLESQLASRCRSYGDMTAFMKTNYQKVKEKLKDGDALIDFTDYVSRSQGRKYVAYLIRKEDDYPLLMSLFAESKIDSLRIAYPDLFYESPNAGVIRRILWEPFQDYVKEGATVYYVPSQVLLKIAIESLPYGDGSLLGDHYRFIRLSSARELTRMNVKLSMEVDPERTNAVLYGGLVYDVAPNTMQQEAHKYDIQDLLAQRGSRVRGDSLCYLPWSRVEIDSIETVLKAHHFNVLTYFEEKGTEESFLSLDGKAPSVLHLATHGFFYTPNEAAEIDYLRGYSDAMSLSGLVMAGGNRAWTGKALPEGVLGGILTASDIASLDLSGVELVVLSACRTGDGEATAEGLYGLQRAFKKAGVKTMVMSLWDVDDMIGTELMTAFYKNLLDESYAMDKRKAFDAAKSLIRDKYREPYYWAGFVMLD